MIVKPDRQFNLELTVPEMNLLIEMIIEMVEHFAMDKKTATNLNNILIQIGSVVLKAVEEDKLYGNQEELERMREVLRRGEVLLVR